MCCDVVCAAGGKRTAVCPQCGVCSWWQAYRCVPAVWCVQLVAGLPLCAAVWCVQLVAGAPLCAAMWCVQLVAGAPRYPRDCDPRYVAHDVSAHLLSGVKRALVSLGVIIVVTACLRGVAERNMRDTSKVVLGLWRVPLCHPVVKPFSLSIFAENSEGQHIFTCQSRLLFYEL